MTMQSMFGVVLWSDTIAQKAVIWCEDQGDLAFYTPEDCIHDAPSLDAGDLIQFDIMIQQNMRRACNPQLLMQSHSPDLPDKLKASHSRTGNGNSKPQECGAQKNVIELMPYFDAMESHGKIAMSG